MKKFYLVTDATAEEVERKTGLPGHNTALGALVEQPEPFRLEVELAKLDRILHPRCCYGAITHAPTVRLGASRAERRSQETYADQNLGCVRNNNPTRRIEMSFLQREHDKLMALCQSTKEGDGYNAMYAAKQALAWALDPDTCASPSAQISRHYDLNIEGTTGTGIGPLAAPLPEASAKAN